MEAVISVVFLVLMKDVVSFDVFMLTKVVVLAVPLVLKVVNSSITLLGMTYLSCCCLSDTMLELLFPLLLYK